MKKCIRLIILLCFIVFIIPNRAEVSANSVNNDFIVKGNISYWIKESGNNTSKKVKKILNNYPITLYYENKLGDISHKFLDTDKNGDFNAVLNKNIGITKVWVVVMSYNDACYVSQKPELNLTNFIPYMYNSNTYSVNDNMNKIHMYVNLNNENFIGAVNIARVINNTRIFMKDQTGIKVSKINVYWTSGKGVDSYVLTDPGKGVGMVLAGADHDERDESVISHEYGHWVFGNLRSKGRFMYGNHSSEDKIDKRLAYSEGLATFFGQAALTNEQYLDGNNLFNDIIYSIETPPSNYPKSKDNEAYVTASLWDTIDFYKSNESWDKVEENLKDVLIKNIDVVLDAKITN
jgi:hypothetical protein